MSETKNLLDYSTEFEGILHCIQNDRSFKSFSILRDAINHCLYSLQIKSDVLHS